MQIGLIGLGTMGANLARNAARNGARVSVYNRTPEKTDAFMAAHRSEGEFVATKTVDEFVHSMQSPRAIVLMVKAGEAVDEMIAQLVPHLSEGDILIDAGNSHYRDTERRCNELANTSAAIPGRSAIRFVGMGVSGGEEGALHGPSMMPGGDRSAYDVLEPLLVKMSADDGVGGKCVTYIGDGGSGHFVKTVHNGIEYGVMQLIAEAYDLLKRLGGLTNAELAETFSDWSKSSELKGFLMEITAQIFTLKDPETGNDLIDMIKDAAAQKGTGKWTTESAFDLGQATPTIDAAVTARMLSGDPKRSHRDRELFPQELLDGHVLAKDLKTLVAVALECSIICVHNQGFHLLEKASQEYGWNLHMDEIARIWRGGCIIRSGLLEVFQRACSSDASIASNAVDIEIMERFSCGRQRDWRRAVQIAVGEGIPIPAMAASLSYFDTLRSERLPQNLIQAQRDFFGAHGFERIDKEGEFHTPHLS